MTKRCIFRRKAQIPNIYADLRKSLLASQRNFCYSIEVLKIRNFDTRLKSD